MDTKTVAEELIGAVDQRSVPERERLRGITNLASGEVDLLATALDNHPRPLASVALKLLHGWDQMTEAERAASLLAITQMLVNSTP